MRTAVRRDAGPTEGEDAGFRRSSSWAAAFRFFACIGTVNLTTRWERGSVSRSALLQPQVLRVTDPRSGWFMESPLSFFRMHWDHEPTPNPSQEGN